MRPALWPGGSPIAVGRLWPSPADVSSEDDVRVTVARAVSSWGRLDILHNNAALVDPALFGRDAKIVDLDVDVWDRTMAVNLRGVMLGCKHAIPAMIAGGGGSIINMSSGSSLVGDLERSAYGASKGGVNAFTTYVATQYGRDRVRANAVLPGLILTPAAAVNVPQELLNALRDSVLLPYFGEPDDIAHLVLYLASEESKYVTGQLFAVNGGTSAHQPTYGQRAHVKAGWWWFERMILERWGVTDAEVARRYPCDDLVPSPVIQLWRGVTVNASPAKVWPWLCQLSLAPYSYDWLDNLGRRSPRELRGLADPTPGEPFSRMGGRFSVGRVLSVEHEEHLTAEIMGAVMSYVVYPEGDITRLLLKIVMGKAHWYSSAVAVGDWPMARRQLKNLKAFSEAR